ncbi:MAG TPA: GNAT family protein [Candidatus Binatia bacterium]
MDRESVKLPFLVGKEIYLRQVTEADVTDAYVGWMSDPEVTRYMGWRAFPLSRKEILEYVANQRMPDHLLLAIVLKQEDRHIGNVHLGPIDWVHRRSELSMVMGDKTAWGKGYMTEAFGLIIAHAFSVLNLNKLKAGTEAGNPAAVRLFHKTGWVEEGVLRRETFREGSYRDIIVFAKFNERLAAGK